MSTAREVQLATIEEMTKSVARVDHAIAKLADLKNPFEIEARIYFIKALLEGSARLAAIYHSEIHIVNSTEYLGGVK